MGADTELWDLLRGRLAVGQRHWASTARGLIAEAAPGVAASLGEAPDRVFLEPCLFALFHARSGSLAQYLFGYLADDLKPERTPVVSSSGGTVYLPNLGYYETDRPDSPLELVWRGSAEASTLVLEHGPVEARFRGVDRLADSPIEVYRSLPPCFRGFFLDPRGRPVDVEVERVAAGGRARLEEAFVLLRRHAPELLGSMLEAIRGVVVYDAPHPFSFATVGAHGVAFLNASERPSTVFFLEDLVHQSAHVVFNAVAWDPSELFAVDPRRSLSELTALEDYHGSLFGAFHGLFTQLNINHCLKSCHDAGVFWGHDAHELRGRISDDMKRFGTAVHALGDRRLYSDLGWSLYERFRAAFVSLYTEMRPLIESYDTSNQPYVFSYRSFLERNPLPEAGGAAP